MINLQSGAVTFDDGFLLDVNLNASAIEVLPNVKTVPSIPGRKQFSAGVHFASEEKWGVGLVFTQHGLTQIWLQCLPSLGLDNSKWTLENEKARKVIHDRFLENLCVGQSIGRTQSESAFVFNFPWGKASSVLDIRGVQALIMLEYR